MFIGVWMKGINVLTVSGGVCARIPDVLLVLSLLRQCVTGRRPGHTSSLEGGFMTLASVNNIAMKMTYEI